jgi:phosphoglycolate phosphatase-like HAD superfamily hydrolase
LYAGNFYLWYIQRLYDSKNVFPTVEFLHFKVYIIQNHKTFNHKLVEKKMRDYLNEMKSLPKNNEFFIGFDSDGCVFDSMEVKHKECFCPAFIKHYNMQSASKYAREIWDFVNLYSKTRGCNRFWAIYHSMKFIAQRPEILARGCKPADTTELEKWMANESKLGNPALEAYLEKVDSAELRQALAWSKEVNARVADMVHGVPPLPGVKEVLASASKKADLIVVSQTPLEALEREWAENGMIQYVNLICGQEHGTKAEHIKYSTEGKYAADCVLMVGDAPGDYKAAAKNNALFFPIVPGREEASWAELLNNGLNKFFNKEFAGAYQQQLLDEFDASLPENPNWQ